MNRFIQAIEQFGQKASLLTVMLALSLLGCAHAQTDSSKANESTTVSASAVAPAFTYTPTQWQARLIEFAETVSPEPDALAQEFGVTWDIALRPNKDAPSSPYKYYKSKTVNWKFEKSPTDFVFASDMSVHFSDEIVLNSISLLLPASRERCINFDALHKYFSAHPWKYVVKQNIMGSHHPLNIYYEKAAERGVTRVSMQKASGSSCLYFYALTRYRSVTPEGVQR